MMMKIFDEKNYSIYDEEKYSMFLYNAFYGGSGTNIFNVDSCHAFFICDLGVLINNIIKWRKILPNIGIVYNTKSNSDAVLIKLLNYYDVKFIAYTSAELNLLINFGLSPLSIALGGICKYNRHIGDSFFHNVDTVYVHTLAELDRVIIHHPNARVILKVSKCLNQMDKYFSRSTKLNLSIHGLFIACECFDKDTNYKEFFNYLNDVVKLATEKYNIIISVINIGPIVPQYSTDESSDFVSFVHHFNTFSQYFQSIEFVAELSTFMFDSVNQLCCSVVGVRKVVDKASNESSMLYFLNDGLYGSLNGIQFSRYKPQFEILKKEGFNIKNSVTTFNHGKSTFWGPTCDSCDKICTFENIPVLSIGDTIVFKNVGPCSYSCATNFNGFYHPLCHYIVSYQQLESLGVFQSEWNEYFCTETIQVDS